MTFSKLSDSKLTLPWEGFPTFLSDFLKNDTSVESSGETRRIPGCVPQWGCQMFPTLTSLLPHVWYQTCPSSVACVLSSSVSPLIVLILIAESRKIEKKNDITKSGALEWVYRGGHKPGTTVQILTHFISINAPEDSILLGSPCLLLNQQKHRAWKTDSRFQN